MGDRNDNFKKILNDLKARNLELEDEVEEHENIKRKFERENRLLKKKAEESSNDLEECQSDKETLEKKFRSLTKEMKELKQKIKDEEENEKYSEEIQKLEKKLVAKENTIIENNKAVNELKETNEDLQDRLNSAELLLEDKLKEKDKELESKNVKIKSLEADIEKKNKEIERVQENIEDENQNKKMLERKMSTQIYEIEHQHCKVENLNEIYAKTAYELDGAKARIVELEREIENLKRLTFNSRLPLSTDITTNPTMNFPSWWKKHIEKSF